MSAAKLALCFCLVALSSVRADEEFEVTTPQGKLKGLKTMTINEGKPMYSFKGIPYAKPNVGPDKFRDPIKADAWDGVLDATQHRPTCVFYCMVRNDIFGEEDCLFINVYTPEVNPDAGRAVMVWFHPGDYNAGAGDDDLFSPDFLIEKDVVVVTFNSRVGAIGYLNTGDANAPGNVGLKDQVMALKWIQDNIQSFGGCYNRVTLFGEDSGGATVQYHMLSPMSQGLFKNAISQSGAVLSTWAYSYTPKENAFALGEILGIKTSDTAELVDKLRQFTALELVDASTELSKRGNYMNGFMNAFLPASEANAGQEVFLPADPWELIKAGKIADVPYMAGVVADEGGLFAPGIIMQDPKMVDENFDKFVPDDLNITDPAQRNEIGESFRKFYLDGKPIDSDPQQAMNLLGDVFFTYGFSLSTEIINERNSAPVYQYVFSHHDPWGFMKHIFGLEDGVLHGDDLGYLWYSTGFKNKPMPGSDMEKMMHILTELWTNFAKESNPTPNMDGMVKVTWEPKGKDDNYLDINLEPKLKSGLMTDRKNFWADIYKNVLGDYSKLFA
ncbi:juvenile hormone esterase-like [Venturia canescens]|uniref:juvenile hormone esterase-like n=1 Tax=Venturia canescens TaxID=32260 RepID=UPI001C9CF236|nr:juvenile hormone esterase-like [Venturia canescens]